MNKIGIVPITILSLAIIIAGYLVGNLHVKARKYERSVQVKGLAEKEVKADLAVWPIQISLAGNHLNDLKSQLDAQKKEVIGFFKNQGFSDEEISTGVTNIQDLRTELYQGNQQYLEFRYVAVINLTIRTKEINKLQKALSESLELISRGILLGSKNSWAPIEYMYTQLNSIKPSMVEEATKNAREVAEKFALDSGSKVGKIKSANQGIFSITDRDQNTPEIKQVRVVSTINYFLED
jgi:uncharacterized protein